MKTVSWIILLIVGLAVIALLVWLSNMAPQPTLTFTNQPPTWTNDVDNEIVVVTLDPSVVDQYAVTVEPFGRVLFTEVGQIQVIDEHTLQLVSVTTTSAQVLISPKRSE